MTTFEKTLLVITGIGVAAAIFTEWRKENTRCVMCGAEAAYSASAPGRRLMLCAEHAEAFLQGGITILRNI